MERGKTERFITQSRIEIFQVIMISSNGRKRGGSDYRWQVGVLKALFTVLQALNHNESDRSTDEWWKTCRVLLSDGSIRSRTRGWPTHPSACHQLKRG